jgi:hypothetical protein
MPLKSSDDVLRAGPDYHEMLESCRPSLRDQSVAPSGTEGANQNASAEISEPPMIVHRTAS